MSAVSAEGRTPFYHVWRRNRAGNISYGDACGLARVGMIPGVLPGPQGMGLEVLVTAERAVEAALLRDA